MLTWQSSPNATTLSSSMTQPRNTVSTIVCLMMVTFQSCTRAKRQIVIPTQESLLWWDKPGKQTQFVIDAEMFIEYLVCKSL